MCGLQRGVIRDPMHSVRVHGAFSSTVDATTSPRVLTSCSRVYDDGVGEAEPVEYGRDELGELVLADVGR